MDKISKRIYEALIIIRDNEGIRPLVFAEKFWPDSDMHRKVKNTGNGACIGKGSWLCAGSYIARLKKKGYVRHDIINGSWAMLTSKGKEIIKKYEEAN